jgi:conjugative relaxase-like TrwC/TraI family protein
MLRVAPVTAGAAGYYLADLAGELALALPAAGGSGAIDLAEGRPGRWMGSGAAGLGLVGPVDGAALSAVLSGHSPATDRPLVRRRGSVGGYDLVFTAPKSVSVLFALGPPEVAGEVVSAHIDAVEAATGYVAQRAMAARRGSGEWRRLEPVNGVVGAAFTHGVSRALDPHLHTHVVVANVGHGRDGRWSAVDGRGLFAHAPAAGHLYGAHLRHQLGARLGVGWRWRHRTSYEVAGIDPAVLGAFSSRRAEIRAHLAERSAGRAASAAGPTEGVVSAPVGTVSRRARHVAWAATRDPKGPLPAPEALVGRWNAAAAAFGFVARDLQAVLGRSRRHDPAVDEHRFSVQLVVSPHATAARRDVVGAWAVAVAEGARAAEVEACTDHLVVWGDAVGVAEERHALAAVVPSPSQLQALGPRPASPRTLGVWLNAAGALRGYRARWGVTDRTRPLGVEGTARELASMETRQLADHLATSRLLTDARRELGRSLGRDAEPPHLNLGRV